MRGDAKRSLFRHLIAFVLLLSGGVACACSVPVFRYALERWNSDVYQVVVFHDGETSAEEQAVIDRLGPEGEAGKKFANVQVHSFDVNQLDPEKDAALIELWKAEETDKLPHMVAYYPPNALARGAIWSGPPSDEAVDNLLDSPARRESARRILKGDTGVWILIEGGDQARDDEKFDTLNKHLRKAERTLKLPEIEAKDVADGLVSIDPQELKIRFSSLRISRKDAQESAFIQMLLRSEPDLLDEEYAEEPFVFPLFGRCRALYALVGDGIAEGTVLEACAFLIGPCTCEIKGQSQNGVDMLTSVDWEGLIEPAVQVDKELPPLAGLGAFTSTVREKPEEKEQPANEEEKSAANETATTSHAPLAESNNRESSGIGATTMFVLALGVIGVICGSVFLTRKQAA